MNHKNKENKPNFDKNLLVSIFICVDDFCKDVIKYIQKYWLDNVSVSDKPQRNYRKPSLSESEIMTILIFYHYSGYKNFQYYYEKLVLGDLKSYFPNACSYNRFLQLIVRVQLPMFVLSKLLCAQNKNTGIYFVDSKQIKVCHNLRIPQNKVFVNTAQRGRSSTGWFFGFKLHLVINHLGEIVSFEFTSANEADNNHNILNHLFKNLKGLCFGDKGYISKLKDYFYEKGLDIITKVRKGMKNQLMPLYQRYLLCKRPLIESVNDILSSVFDIEHSRHRKPENAFTSIFAGIIAYCFYPQKPSIVLHHTEIDFNRS